MEIREKYGARSSLSKSWYAQATGLRPVPDYAGDAQFTLKAHQLTPCLRRVVKLSMICPKSEPASLFRHDVENILRIGVILSGCTGRIARVRNLAGRELPLKDDGMVVGRHSDFGLKDEAAAGRNGCYFV